MPWSDTHSRFDTRHAVYQHATFSYSYPPFLKSPYTSTYKIQTPQTLACGVCMFDWITYPSTTWSARVTASFTPVTPVM
jgi:hypothetical protein